MPSNKPRVTSYLEKDEYDAFREFKEENELSDSEAVNLLVRNYLIENDDVAIANGVATVLAGRLDTLEKRIESLCMSRVRNCEAKEKQNELIAGLQEDIEALQKSAKHRDVVRLTDGQVAAITGKSEHLVALWRNGLQKPRGKRVKEALKPYEVVDGIWVKKTDY